MEYKYSKARIFIRPRQRSSLKPTFDFTDGFDLKGKEWKESRAQVLAIAKTKTIIDLELGLVDSIPALCPLLEICRDAIC